MVTHYLPGAIVAGRYRMVGMLGRGGMGEVYRADDLKLGQPVALKFLSDALHADTERVHAFVEEARLSLRVTHPNVCRVYDIGEIDGRQYLAMEYVDGEDLASLLRRIGRLPEEKAIDLARQMCAGLAAAHDEGVLHRDIKPANIMIDGRGRAKITDFGLAGATAGIDGAEARAGTPQYMAPEQFDGAPLSERTDIYSLGLVLYELFTGKPAFEGRSIYELAAMRSSLPSNPSLHVSGLNPVVERAILRCLEPEAAKRPASALQLSAMLPGGDPLAMALAAGETPSPELVAQAGGSGELQPWIAAGLLVTILACLGVVWYAGGAPRRIENRVPLPKTPAELRVDARAVLRMLGDSVRQPHSEDGFQYDREYFAYVERTDSSMHRWDSLATVRPAPITFWYREASRELAPSTNDVGVSFDNPPLVEPGMTRVRLDPAGRLVEFIAVPQTIVAEGRPWPEPNWTRLFAAAGFADARWTPTEPEERPPTTSDVRRAWKQGSLRIEATAFQGRVTYFELLPPWSQRTASAPAADSPMSALMNIAGSVVFLLIMAGSAILARRNVRQARSDSRGAVRTAGAFVVLGVVIQLLQLNGAVSTWGERFVIGVRGQLFPGIQIWLMYLAVEPFVRRNWPETLISWNRVLEGRLRDPLVGRHILVGAVAGFAVAWLQVIPTLFGPADSSLLGMNAAFAWTSAANQLESVLSAAKGSLALPVFALICVLVARLAFRKPAIAYVALTVLATVITPLSGERSVVGAITTVVIYGLTMLLLTRVGLLALIVSVTFSSWRLMSLTPDIHAWFFPQSVATVLFFGAVACYAFGVSLGAQSLFKESVLD